MLFTRWNPCCFDMRLAVIIIASLSIAADVLGAIVFLVWLLDYSSLEANYFENSPVSLEIFRKILLIMLILSAVDLIGSIIVLVGAIIKKTWMLYFWHGVAFVSYLNSVLVFARGGESFFVFTMVVSLVISVLIHLYLSWCVQCFIASMQPTKTAPDPQPAERRIQLKGPVVSKQENRPPTSHPSLTSPSQLEIGSGSKRPADWKDGVKRQSRIITPVKGN